MFCALLTAALIATAAHAAPGAGRSRFIVGMPGRFDGASDRAHARRYEGVDSAVRAYVDVDEVEDPTWLRYEVERYARHAFDCARMTAEWCARGSRRLGGTAVIHIAAGVHGELVWTSGRHAVRIGWRRVVETATGTMTLDMPPADFASSIAAKMPGDRAAGSWRASDARYDEDGDDAEIDRLLYYADRAAVVLLARPISTAQRWSAEHLVAANLARIARLRGLDAEISAEPPDARADGLPTSLAEALASVRWWRAERQLQPAEAHQPWCSAPRLAAVIGDAPVWR
jgi:hypothetical protein